MFINFKIPIKRKLLIEKYITKNIKVEENKFILEFLDSKNNPIDTFLVYSDSIPTLKMCKAQTEGIYEFDRRISWEEMDFFILENLSYVKKNSFLKWINLKKQKAKNIKINRTYNNNTKTKENWGLFGCLIKSTFDTYDIEERKEHGLGITIKFNHCTIKIRNNY